MRHFKWFGSPGLVAARNKLRYLDFVNILCGVRDGIQRNCAKAIKERLYKLQTYLSSQLQRGTQ